MNNNHAYLLIDIQKQSNIHVTNTRDLKYLKDEIESFNDLKIGYNTLRRLFGFLKKTTPTISTLNTLSKYLGHNSYTNYLNSNLKLNEWYFQQKLLLIQRSNNITEDDLKIINNGMSYRNNIISVAYYISNLIQVNNITLLNIIFEKLLLNNILIHNLLKFATIITHSFYSINEDKALVIYTSLTKHENFRDSVPLLYIDYSNLNTLYNKVLELVKKYSVKESDLFFVSLMQFYKQFYTEDKLNTVQINQPKHFTDFYPVLQGRYFAYKIMLSNTVDPTLKRLIFTACKTNNAHSIVEEVIPSLIIKEEYEILNELSEKFYEDIFESFRWSNSSGNAIYLIGLANINCHQNSIKNAKKNLELIKLEEVELSYYDYISLFYYLTKIKISHLDNDIETNSSAYTILKQLVLKTGFQKFLDVSKEYILK